MTAEIALGAYHRNPGGEEKTEHNAPHEIFADGADATCITSGMYPPICFEHYVTSRKCTSKTAASLSHLQVPMSSGSFYLENSPQNAARYKECGLGIMYSQASVSVSTPDGQPTEEHPPVPFEGSSAHLQDFGLDNSKWEHWGNDLHQMCDTMSRFNIFIHMNEKQ
ncbi:hypothetical protein K504DRAFT_501239 [Pleomassaria siparia CBS 279.74]|uniref:Uncharacterized protein n=1 Tax=Pleomassaria siparia CBS 279.74 TaxID=1314801 RepID=A0A6G1KAL2_9PLEO|nr:hypothetical protein K504DRAFT_501239 [Pleomassaria siparia CBS 279.74]